MEIHWLGEHPSWVPRLARWHVAAFADAIGGWKQAQAEFELRGHCAKRAVPTTWVAVDDEQPIGSVSLLDSDPPAPDHLAPWFATLFVDRRQRGRGVGSLLSRHAVSAARELGLAELHLWTPHHADFYSRMGWQSLGRRSYGGADVTLMRIDTGLIQ